VSGFRRTPSRGGAIALLCLQLAASKAYCAEPQLPPYTSADAVKAAEAAKPPSLPERPPEAVVRESEELEPVGSGGRKILVEDLRVEGAEFLDAKALEATLNPYRHRELTLGEINRVASRVTALLRQQGYLVARAYVPKQDLRDGVLTLTVIAGQYGKFVMKNHSLVRDSVLQGIFDEVRDFPVQVTKEGLEQAMLMTNDLPGARMPVVSIERGEAPGTSDFVVETPASNRLGAYVSVDNYGSPLTGKDRLSAGLSVNSPTGFGDKLAVDGMTSNGAGLQNGRVAYDIPLFVTGLRGELAVSKTTYVLGDAYAPLSATGAATSAEGNLLYTAARGRSDSLYLLLGVASRRMHDDVGATSTSIAKRARVGWFGVQEEHYGKLFGFDAYRNISATLTAGRLQFDDPAQRAANWAGADTEGDYSKFGVALSEILAFDRRWSLAGNIRAQKSLRKNLDGSEQLSVSGASGIKAYPDGVIGDNGYLVNAELKYALSPSSPVAQSLSLIADYASVSPQNGAYTTIHRVAISDVGVAYAVTHRYFYGKLDLVETTGSAIETKTYNHRFKVLALLGGRF
jgi:hemolysin activation/secretion protein